MAKCVWKDCQNEATHALEVFVPPTGFIATRKNSINMICGLEVCRRHTNEFDINENPEIKELVTHITKTIMKSQVPPDFERAWVVPIKLNDPRYLEFKQKGKPS